MSDAAGVIRMAGSFIFEVDGQQIGMFKEVNGLRAEIMVETLEEVSRCKRSNIMINTFMLASDFTLVQFVQTVSAMCRGKAYFTTPQTLGNYLLMDFMSRRMKTIH